MNNKKCRLFLWISLIVFACSVIVVLGCFIESYNQIKTDPDTLTGDFFLVLLFGIAMVAPILALELSCIRSAYKILKHAPKGAIKMCYMISAILAFLTFVFQWLILFGVIRFDHVEYEFISRDILLFVGWPVFILSFVLGSICKKQDG